MSKNRMAVMAPALKFAFSDNISAENSKFSALKGNPNTNRNNKRAFLILYNGEYFFEGNMLNVVLKVCE